MASGFNYTGGRSRCFERWQVFMKCYAKTDNPSECKAPAEDYLECLHHAKEISRAKTIRYQFIKRAHEERTEGRKAAEALADGVVVGVGLISKSKNDEGSSEQKP